MGEWSAPARGNITDPNFHASMSYCANFYATPQGSIKKRNGLLYQYDSKADAYRIESYNVEGTDYLFQFVTASQGRYIHASLSTTCNVFDIADNGQLFNDREVFSNNVAPYYLVELNGLFYAFTNNAAAPSYNSYVMAIDGSLTFKATTQLNFAAVCVTSTTINDIGYIYMGSSGNTDTAKNGLYSFKQNSDGTITQIGFIHDSRGLSFKNVYCIKRALYTTEYIDSMGTPYYHYATVTYLNDDGGITGLAGISQTFKSSVPYVFAWVSTANALGMGYTSVTNNDSIVAFCGLDPNGVVISTQINTNTLVNAGLAWTCNAQNNYFYYIPAAGSDSLIYQYAVFAWNNFIRLGDVSDIILSSTSHSFQSIAFDGEYCYVAVGNNSIYQFIINLDGTLSLLVPPSATAPGIVYTLLSPVGSFGDAYCDIINLSNNNLSTVIPLHNAKVNSIVQNNNALYLLYANEQPLIMALVNGTWGINNFPTTRHGPWNNLNQDQYNAVDIIYTSGLNCNIFSAASPTLRITVKPGFLFQVQLQAWPEDDTADGHTHQFPQWQAQHDYAVGDRIYNAGQNYILSGAAGKSGDFPPIHTEGTYSDGNLYWTWLDSGYAYFLVNGFTSLVFYATQIYPTQYKLGNYQRIISYRWATDAWQDNLPQIGTIFQGRSVFVNRNNSNIWFSGIGDPLDFDPVSFGQVQDDTAINFSAISQQGSVYTFLAATRDGLLIGTNFGERLIYEADISHPFSATNIKLSDYRLISSREVTPLKVKDTVLFVQDGGKNIREVSSFSAQEFRDLSYYSNSVVSGKIIKLAYQREPEVLVWVIDDANGVYNMVYDSIKNIYGIHRVTFSAPGNTYLRMVDLCVAPQSNRVYILVKNIFNNLVSIFTTAGDAIFDTSFIVSSPTPITTFTIPFLASSAIQNIYYKTSTGRTWGAAIIDNIGLILFPEPITQALVGWAIDAFFNTEYIEAISEQTSTLGKTKKIDGITLRLLDTTDVVVNINGAISTQTAIVEQGFDGYAYSIYGIQNPVTFNMINDSLSPDKFIQIISSNNGYAEIQSITAFMDVYDR